MLAHPAELLVLDEPTNHLDLGAVSWLEQRLLAFRGGLVLVTHDRHLLDRLTTRMLELDRGGAYVHEGGYGVLSRSQGGTGGTGGERRNRPGATWPDANWRGSGEEPRPGRVSRRPGSTLRSG